MFTYKPLRTPLFVVGILSITIITFWWSNYAAAHSNTRFTIGATNINPLIREPFNISWNSIDEQLPAVVYNPIDREYLVVWENQRTVQDDIYAQRISEQGKLLSWFYVADGENPVVAYNPKNNTYLVVYERYIGSDYDVYARRVNYNGPLGAAFPVAFNLNETEHSPAVAYNTHPNHDEFLVVWENIPPPPSIINKVEGWQVAGSAGGGNAGGELISTRLPIADNSHYNYDPDVAYNLNMNEYLVVFTRLPGGGGSYDIYGRRITGPGALLAETAIDSSGGDQSNPAVAAYRLNQATPYLVVFNDTWNDTAGDVRGYLVNKDGDPVQLINIATVNGLPEFDPAIAHSESWDGYVVTWTQGLVTDHEIFGTRVSDIGLTHPEFDISGTSTAPSLCDRETSVIAVGNASALAAWTDPCGNAGGLDILGRILGYQIYLPFATR